MSAQLRPGYKQTEAGVIPADWSPHTIGDLVDFEGGSQPDKSVFRQSWKAGYVRLIQIRDYKTDKYETYIPWSLARRFCNESDIMIGRYGPPVFQILRGIDGAYNVALIKAKPCPAINNSYAYYFLKQEKLFAFIEKLSRRSSGQTGVDLKELRQYPLPLPSIEEQETIAEALSDADALIELLEQLLAKKRHLKQGTMQELLTGKKRLPGFSGEWEQTRLGDSIEKFIGGGTPSRANSQYWGDEIPWVTVKDFATFNPRYSQESITKTGLRNSASHLIPKGTLITSTRMALGKAVVYEVDVAINQDLKALFPRSGLDTQYLYFWFEYYGKFIDELGSGSTVKGISLPELKKIQLNLPPIKEQAAIVTILADMDAELAELEAKLEKSRSIKQGMMQKLLTGEIRLL
ncbi:restriction endonuclease subunit S [Zoogloea oleivorans]|uniref:Restriction endonuclease subunit S n=1 Tax=Zoogloea oleivorans TaxID=1552750 RepID=A0A6C2D3E5_9RHOO|nr:restriction endonuclease subunit S [Zoogloea oleivorans]TYC60938.1 restriction endonuclease subunit S [Zoogloea oleivorans]